MTDISDSYRTKNSMMNDYKEGLRMTDIINGYIKEEQHNERRRIRRVRENVTPEQRDNSHTLIISKKQSRIIFIKNIVSYIEQ